MNAIELVIIACSIVQGGKCNEHPLVFNDVTLMTCMISAAPIIAKWGDEHPNHSIQRWTCRTAGQFANL